MAASWTRLRNQEKIREGHVTSENGAEGGPVGGMGGAAVLNAAPPRYREDADGNANESAGFGTGFTGMFPSPPAHP